MKKLLLSLIIFTTLFGISFAEQPVLYSDSFTYSAKWNSPILKLKSPSNDNAGIPSNAFVLKGENIFSENSTFRLVPKNESQTGVAFDSFTPMQDEILLEIFSADSNKKEVILEYNSEEIPSGYYDLIASNSEGKSTSLELLILTNTAPVIDTSTFEYDENYKVHVLSIPQGKPYYLKLRGKGFNSSTLYTFYPTSPSATYPFSSSYEFEEAIISFDSYSTEDLEPGSVELTLKIDTPNLLTGYYNLDINNGYAGKTSLLFLVKIQPKEFYNPEIETIETKVSGQDVVVTITGDNMDDLSNFTLIKPYSDQIDGNERISLEYLQSKKKETVHILQFQKSDLEPGKYAFFIENLWATETFYYEIDEKYDFSELKLTEEQKESLFLRPKSKPANHAITSKVIEPKFEIYPLNFNIYMGLKPILPALHVKGSLMTYQGYDFSAANFDVTGTIDLLYLRWARLDAGVIYYSNELFGTSGLKYGGDIYFEIPWKFVKPFVGVGFYATQDKNFTLPVQAGLRFLDLFDFTYQLSFEDFLTPGMYAIDKYTLGIQIPIRKQKFYYSTAVTGTDIADPDSVDGKEYKLQKNTTLVSLDSKTVGGFQNNSSLDSIHTSVNVRIIESRAFANMKNLKIVKLQKGLTTIGSEAFLNDTNVSTITIPDTVTSIGKDAFAGWTMGQTIKLSWSSEDETPRDIPGLYNSPAKIIYADNVYLNNPTDSGVYNPDNWTIEEVMFSGTARKSSYVKKDGSTTPAINFTGYSSADAKGEISCTFTCGSAENPLYTTSCKGIKFDYFNDATADTLIKIFYVDNKNPSKIKYREESISNHGKTDMPISIKFAGSDCTIMYIEVKSFINYTDTLKSKAFYNIKLSNFELMQ